MKLTASASLVACLTLVNAVPVTETPSQYPNYRVNRFAPTNDTTVVDLGYAVYRGVRNETTRTTNWLGLRFAASTAGKNRWQPPQPPVPEGSDIKDASAYPTNCPQSPNNQGTPPDESYDYAGSEDCLFLSVQSPIDTQPGDRLPVLVSIHGGGYGAGSGSQPLNNLINSGGGTFVGVAIQYRLGAFGFLSSDEVARFGTANAGILDQAFSLQWVQRYIHLFGGDPTKVTIQGESAGGGSVMLHVMAYGGTLGTSLFESAIVASPFLPKQYNYNDFIPSQAYYTFAQEVGCFGGSTTELQEASQQLSGSIFQCLVDADTDTLQRASAVTSVTVSGFGEWGFLPVTDGTYVRDLPTKQLLAKKVNGKNILSGNNANEAPGFVPRNITTQDEFKAYLRRLFPLFTDDDVGRTLKVYASADTPVDPSDPLYATAGDSGATAVNVSTYATGQQQRAYNLYAETTFVCPSYWLAEAFSGNDRAAYKYQYSVIPGNHASDVAGYFGPQPPYQSDELQAAFQTIYSSFILQGTPTLATSNASYPGVWPAFTVAQPLQVNLNQTGGTPRQINGPGGQVLTQFVNPGLVADISLVDANTWEGGRGDRCRYWREIGENVPEKLR